MGIAKDSISNNVRVIYLTVLIYPLWTLFLSFKHFRMPQAKNLFWLFCIFLGMIHIFSPEEDMEFDGNRYAERLIEFHQEPVSLANFASSFYEDGLFVDIYQPVITYTLSMITANPHWLFLIFALVFGFFYSRNIWFVLEKFPKIIGIPLLILTIYYILICPVWEINGVRMWTALHVFVYGALPYLYHSDKSKLIWCFVSILIHFSFILPLIILLVYYFVPKSINILLAFYVISFFIKEIDIAQIRDFLLPYVPSFLSDRVSGYTNEEYAYNLLDAKSNLNFYVEGSQLLVKWILAILLFISCIWGKTIIREHEKLLNLMCFSLFIYAIFNILSAVPSIGRFIILSQMFAFVSIIFFYMIYKQSKFRQKGISLTFKYLPLLLLFPIIFMLRTGCDYYGISLFFNPISVLFIEDNQPIIQHIKTLFVK